MIQNETPSPYGESRKVIRLKNPWDGHWFNSACEAFNKSRVIDRWDLTNPEDRFQCWYSVMILGFHYLELATRLQRDRQYARSHSYYGKYEALRIIETLLFPYKDGSGDRFSSELSRVEREIQELEDKFSRKNGEMS